MSCIARGFVVLAMLLVSGVANAQDFKSQAKTAAATFDAAFNSGDPAKVGQTYTKNAIILPAGGQPVNGPSGAGALFGSFMKGGVKSHKITVEGAEAKGDIGYAYGKWQADAGGKTIGGHWTNVLEKESGQWHTALHTWTMEQQP